MQVALVKLNYLFFPTTFWLEVQTQLKTILDGWFFGGISSYFFKKTDIIFWMKSIKIQTTINLPAEKVWQLFIDPKNYVKYFKYINGVFYKGKMKKGYIWFDLATVVYFPALVLHKVTEFEENKRIQFYVPLPLIGKIVETVDLQEKNNKTYVKAIISYEYGSIFGPIFNNIFEKRMRKSISGALIKLNKEI